MRKTGRFRGCPSNPQYRQNNFGQNDYKGMGTGKIIWDKMIKGKRKIGKMIIKGWEQAK
jgi:hypothetical protein